MVVGENDGMTRIIAGDLRGRRLRVPDDGTRPTSDRVREAVFSMLDARVDLEGARVLDLYAGSGALGIEALSRGAEQAVFVDVRRKATAVIDANLREVSMANQSSVLTRPVRAFLDAGSGEPFDLVFSDPPYDFDDETLAGDLSALTDGWVVDGGLVVVERGLRSGSTPWPTGFTMVVDKKYGDTRVEVASRDE